MLAGDGQARVRRAVARFELPSAVRGRLAGDGDPGVRAAAVTAPLWSRAADGVREGLLADPAPEVRVALAGLFERGPEVRPAPRARIGDPGPAVRGEAAQDLEVPTRLALELARGVDDLVRLSLSMREDLTEQQRAAIACVVPRGCHQVPRWIGERGHEPDVARRGAASGHVLLRRSIALQRRLPADVVDRLAVDEDFFVRLTLCQGCRQARTSCWVRCTPTGTA